MVASVAALKSAAQASSYYEADDYYSEGGEAPSAWFGKGADELRLAGEVDRKAFARGLEGQLPNRKQLGTVRNGEREHRPGWDVTFSAPKSVSIMAEVGGDTCGAVEATIAGDGRRALEALDRGGGRVAELAEVGDRRAAMARDYAALTPRERARTLVMDTTREGRELLTDAIRAELRRDGMIGAEGVAASTLESKGLTPEEARHAHGYEPGDVVTFRRDYDRHGVEKGQAYRVSHVDRDTNRIELRDHDGRAIDWRLEKWGRGQAEAFAEVRREFSPGDRVQFTRNDREAGRVNGATATVTAIDAERRTVTATDARGREHVMQLDQAGDRHVRHGWVGTVHGSQGATAERSMTHLESFPGEHRGREIRVCRDQSRAAARRDLHRQQGKLATAIETRTGEREAALASERASSGKTAESGRGMGLG